MDTPNDTPSGATPSTPDAAVNNTAANPTGAATETQSQATPEKTFTQAEVDAMISQRLPRAVKAELKRLSADETDKPSADDLQRQLSERDTKIRAFEARETVENFLSDGRNKLNVPPGNVRGIQAIVIPLLQYGEDGQATNLKEAIDTAKTIAPALFANHQSTINANSGNGHSVMTRSMDDLIRSKAGFGN